MLTDTRLRHLKPKDKHYKVNDRDGLYVAVTPAGTIIFRYNYSINGRQETVTFGRHHRASIVMLSAPHLKLAHYVKLKRIVLRHAKELMMRYLRQLMNSKKHYKPMLIT